MTSEMADSYTRAHKLFASFKQNALKHSQATTAIQIACNMRSGNLLKSVLLAAAAMTLFSPVVGM